MQTKRYSAEFKQRIVHRAQMQPAGNAHTGWGFDEFLVEEAIFEEVQARVLKRALAEQLEEGMVTAKPTKIRMAEQMKTSRSQLNSLPELSDSPNSPLGGVVRFNFPSASKGAGQREVERTR